MKRFLMLSILIAAVSISLMGTFAFAEEDMTRPPNPGVDPVLGQGKNQKASKVHATVANPGIDCPECISRLIHSPIHKDTIHPTVLPSEMLPKGSDWTKPQKGRK